MGFRVGYHNAEPMRKGDGESYDAERRDGVESRCCVADVEQLRKLKGKHTRYEMEASGPKDWWESETDQDERGETRRRI